MITIGLLKNAHILRCVPDRDAHILTYMLRFPVLTRLSLSLFEQPHLPQSTTSQQAVEA
jgi:hypothetical protein